MRNKRYAFPTNNHSKSHDSTITSYRTQSPNCHHFRISARFPICYASKRAHHHRFRSSARFRIRHASKRAHHHQFRISARFPIRHASKRAHHHRFRSSPQFPIRHGSERAHSLRFRISAQFSRSNSSKSPCHIYPIARRSIRIDPRRNSHYHLGQPRHLRKHDPRTRSNRRCTRR